MSSISQTPRRAPMSFGVRFGASMAVVVVIVALSMGNVSGPVARLVAQADPHWPNMALFTALSPVIKVHLTTALAALVLGGVLMTVRKGRTFHRVGGWAWVSLVLATAGSTIFIRDLNHGSWSWLHLFTGWVLLITPLVLGQTPRRAPPSAHNDGPVLWRLRHQSGLRLYPWPDPVDDVLWLKAHSPK